ncbi:MAG: right-handed parallel beta-helix repeat-containing protein, partial [Thermoplasmata archaeon]
LTLEGENNETTILDGTGLGTLSKGIYLEGQSGVTLQNLKIQGFEDGIYSCLYSDGNTISGNILSGNINRGLLLYDSDSNTITMNTISGSTKGISLIRSWSNTISGNTASGNKHGIYSFRCFNLISGNTLLYNILNGIYLDEGGHRTITGNTLSYNANGIKLYKSKSNLISENTVSDNQFYGITLQSSMSNTVSGNTVTGNKYGLELSSSDSTILNGNTVSSNLHGIDLWYSDSCLITENAVSDNYYGIRLHTSSSNTLRSNIMTNNVNNFGVDGSYTDHLPLSAYIQDIDTSNTVDGKPIYYWVGHSDETIPLDAGYVGIVDSENIMVEDLTLTNNHQGVLIANSNACAIQNVVVSGNYIGILLCSSETNTISDNLVLDNIGGIILSYSSSNTISGNTVSGNDMGIYLSFYSNSNTISENTISGSKYGIHLYSSSSNTISGNTVSQSHHWCIDLSRSDTNTICENIVSGGDYGIRMSSSSSNLIYHNNIIDNLEQAYDDNPENNDWHHPEWLEGNYWSDYTGEDTGGMEYPWDTTEKHLIADDGIGDTEVPHPGVNYDYYPLMEPWESNQPPVITSLTGPIDPIAVNTEFGMLGTFEDPDSEDTHTAIWDWGDDSTSDGTVNELEGTVSGSYAYLTPGVYTITLTVEDAAGESDTATYELYVVIYDPTGAFVTGAGMINSPLGAFPKDPTLTGKAGFGFVSKYQTGALVPDGNTQFRFQAGDIKFQSDSYDWLVVAGPKAMFKGTGTINGEGNYGFLLSAIDADLTPSTDVDLFRIKIWDKDNDDAIEYDNGLGAPDDADPETQVTHGSIKIHKA